MGTPRTSATSRTTLSPSTEQLYRQTVLGTSTNAYYGLDFDPSGTVLYALNDTNDTLGTINLTTGLYALVSCPPAAALHWTVWPSTR